MRIFFQLKQGLTLIILINLMRLSVFLRRYKKKLKKTNEVVIFLYPFSENNPSHPYNRCLMND